MNIRYELAIAHRVCPILAKTASHYKDKYEMVKATTDSLAIAVKGIRTKVFVILDKCGEEYERLFDETFGEGKIAGVDYERISTPGIGNNATYAKQFEWLSSMVNCSKFLYFSEDDYIYSQDAFLAMMDFLGNPDVDFVTPLDHPDRYSHSVAESVRSEIRCSTCCHWRTVGTTCCTFMTKANVFKKSSRLIESYGKGASDGVLWLGLTKDAVFNPRHTFYAAIRYLLGKRTTTGGEMVAVATWLFHGIRLLFTKRYKLWGPVPSLAVHLCTPSLPPFYNRLLNA